MKIMFQQQVLLLFGFALIIGLLGCGKAHTRKLLLHKTWHVVDVTPPENGNFDIEASRAAEEMKNGFYRNASFTFLDNGLFFTDFNGKTDTGRYAINPGGKIISLYPLRGNKIYEQIRIRELNDSTLSFTTVMANFDMVLHLKAY
ncbi:MAG: hypothetical protein IRZ01_04220 [Thermoflavifilum aggregans]|nr:hypothetical protein [Thermoflavifilum aggregans]